MGNAINERIKALRIESGLYQSSIAEKLGCSAATVSYYENGRSLTYDVIIAYCNIFHVSADWLLGLTTDRHPGGSPIAKEMDALATMIAQAEGTPVTSDQLSALLRAYTDYYRKGARAGHTPVKLLYAFLSALRKALVCLSGDNTAEAVASVNALSATIVDAHAMIAAYLEGEAQS